MLKSLLAACLVAAVTSSATAAPQAPTGLNRPDASVVLSKTAAGWTATYRFNRSAPVWFFPRTSVGLDGQNWRLATQHVDTRGVRLVRLGAFDALVRDDGKPLKTVRLSVTPYTKPLVGDYPPVQPFTDGGLSFYTGHFSVAPASTPSEVATIAGDATLAERRLTMTVEARGRQVIAHGRVHNNHTRTDLNDDGVYIYVGQGKTQDAPAFTRLVDPGAPAWARVDLDAFLPQLMGLYAEQFQTLPGAKPIVLVAYGGDAQPGYSQSGGVIGDMLVLTLSGHAMASPNERVRQALHVLLGHEAAHFWLGAAVRYRRLSDNWITEGGADYLSFTALRSLALEQDGQTFWQRELDDCLALVGPGQALSGPLPPKNQHAVYSCGAILHLAAASVHRRRRSDEGDFGFVRALLAAAAPTGETDAAMWLDLFEQDAGRPARASVQRFIEQGVSDPAAYWFDLLSQSGVAIERDGEHLRLGTLVPVAPQRPSPCCAQMPKS